MADAEVTGLDDLVRVSKALKATGDKGLRRELSAGLNRATKPTREDLNAAIPDTFPSGGGLAGQMAKRARFSVSTRASERTTAVRLVARGKGRRTLQNATQHGQITHPVFGNRKVWVTQTSGVKAGLEETAFEKNKPTVKREVLGAIARVRDQIYRSV